MVLTLRYGDISATVSEANKLASELDQYCNDLSNKVQQKMYSVEGGMSSALNSADYYVRTKINQLRVKSDNARVLSSKLQTLHDTAKRVDSDVKSTIEANQKSFFNKNPELRPSNAQLWLTSFLCDVKKVPVLGWIINKREQLGSAIDTLKSDIRYWWECGGGEELITNCIDIVVKVGLAVAAVLVAVSAIIVLATATVITGGMILVAIAASVAAVIAVTNAITNVITSVQAISSGSQHPAMAKIYAERDSLAQVLREENFHNPFLNRLSYEAATVIEVTDTVCSVILIVNDISKAATKIKSAASGGLKNLFTVQNKNALGQFTKGRHFTLKSIWNGTKSLLIKGKSSNWLLGGMKLSDDFYTTIDKAKKVKEISSVIKNVSGVLDSFNDVLKGDRNLLSFFAQRGMDGLFTNLETNDLFANRKKIIDRIGITKLITDFIDPNGTLTYINDSSSGLIQKIEKLIKTEKPYESFKLPGQLLPKVYFPTGFGSRYLYFDYAA